jgi:tryptophan synthase alpha chain
LADGPTIQHASEASLRRGVSISDAFRLIRNLRKKGLKLPVIFFSYLNPIYHYGARRLAKELKRCGFDGLIIPDLPIEEGAEFEKIFKAQNLSLVYLIAPTTNIARAKKIAGKSSDFIYYVSLRGVTGATQTIPKDLHQNVKAIKKITRKSVLVGFGVSNAEQARNICKIADGIIVGSAIIERLKTKNPVRTVSAYVRNLAQAIRTNE